MSDVDMGPGFLPPPNSSASASLPSGVPSTGDRGMGGRVNQAEKLVTVLGDTLTQAEVDLINKKGSAANASTDALSSDRPNPAKPNLFATTLAAIGGEKGTSGSGNPYFAPNPIAILSAQIYAFYSVSRQISLGMAHVENEGMKLVAEQAKSNAEAQIAAGQKEAMSHYGMMVMGAAQIIGGMAQIGGALYATMKVQQTAVKVAEEAAKEAAKAVEDSTAKFATAQTKHLDEVTKLETLQKTKTQLSASTSLPDASKEVKLELDIVNQQKQVDKAAKQMDDAAEIMNADKKVYAAEAQVVTDAKNEVQQTRANITTLAQGINTLSNGLGQVSGHYIQANAAQQKAIEEAYVTIGQSLVQLLQRGLIESTHSAGESNSQTMSGLLQALDKAVDAHAQANNMKG